MAFSISLIEIIILMLGAIVLGVTIHFFIVSRQNLNASPIELQKKSRQVETWKLKYFNDIQGKDRYLLIIKKKLEETEESNHIYAVEGEELNRQNKRL